MKLLASLTSPYARKIRVLLAEKALPYELVVDSPWEANTRVPEVNPLGKVPALVADDGEVFFDSPVIADYLELIAPEPLLLPAMPMDRLRVRQQEALADGITDAAVAAFLETRRPPVQQSADNIARQRDKIERALAALANTLGGRPWLCGEVLTRADVAAGCALFYLDLRLGDIAWREVHPALAALAGRLGARASFADTRPPL